MGGGARLWWAALCPKSNSDMGGGARAGPYDPSNAFVWIALVKEKRVYISQSVHVVLYMQPLSL